MQISVPLLSKLCSYNEWTFFKIIKRFLSIILLFYNSTDPLIINYFLVAKLFKNDTSLVEIIIEIHYEMLWKNQINLNLEFSVVSHRVLLAGG